MNDKVITFLSESKIGVLSVALPSGVIHGATMHFSHLADPLTLFFSTSKTSKKFQAFLNGSQPLASMVIGVDDNHWVTLQMSGTMKLITDADSIDEIKKIHYPKHPKSAKFENDPNTIFLAFYPTWWRFTDFTSSPPEILATE